MIESILKRPGLFFIVSLTRAPLKPLLPRALVILALGGLLFSQACDAPSKKRPTEKASILYVSKFHGKIHFRTGDRVFSEDPEGEINSVAKKWVPSREDKWTPLLDLGPENASSSRLFSFRSFPKSDQVLLVIETRPQLIKGYTAPFPSYVVFRYSESSENQKSALLLTFSRPLKGGPYVAKIDRFSPDEKHVSFNLYTCWSCVGVHPNKVLLDLETLVVKDIGKVSYFKWNAGSTYEYKDYLEKNCFEDDSAFRYKCPEDPSKLPLKKGVF